MNPSGQHSHRNDFVKSRHGDLLWEVRQASLNDALVKVLVNPEEWLRTRARLFKGFERSSTVGAADGIVVKRPNRRKALNALKDFFRASRAARAFYHARQLETIGVATPRAIAVTEKRCFRFLLTSYLVTEEIPKARHLGEYLATTSRPDEKIIHDLANLIARLHNGGFSHRDLKESNILLDDALKPYLIDLDGLRYLRHVPDTRAAADLARFGRGAKKYKSVGHHEGTVFMQHYLRTRKLKHLPRIEMT